MAGLKCYCDSSDEGASQLILSPEESLHLVSSNRARQGDRVVALNGKGVAWACNLAQADKRKAILNVERVERHGALPYTLALGQALPKGKLFESIARRATEIGAAHLHPIVSAHSAFKDKKSDPAGKADKWRLATIEAAKQCGIPFLPKINEPCGFDAFLETTKDSYELMLIASLQDNSVSIKSLFASLDQSHLPHSAIALVGPEGDFSAEETQKAFDAGFRPICLGPNVLRCETAAVACLSLLQQELSAATK